MALTQVDQGLLGTNAQYTGFKNRIINGAMVIDQRNAGAIQNPVTANSYTVDRWQYGATVVNKFYSKQNAGAVTPPVGFINYLGLTSLSVYTLVAGDRMGLFQAIEGFNCADLAWGTANAQTVTVSFWVQSSLTGTFGGTVANGAYSRGYTYSYTINSANTWEYKTITIPGDTSGTWLTNNGVGVAISWAVGVFSTLQGTPGSWGSTVSFAPTGQVNVAGTSGATFYITGVQLEKGSTATSFDYRPYGTELLLCQRYYYQSWGSGAFANVGSSFGGIPIPNTLTQALGVAQFPVSMRASPTVVLYDDAGTSSKVSQPGLANNLAAAAGNVTLAGWSAAVAAVNYTVSYPVRGHYTAAIEL